MSNVTSLGSLLLTTPYKISFSPISICPLCPAWFYLITPIINCHQTCLFIDCLFPSLTGEFHIWFLYCSFHRGWENVCVLEGIQIDSSFLRDWESSSLDHTHIKLFQGSGTVHVTDRWGGGFCYKPVMKAGKKIIQNDCFFLVQLCQQKRLKNMLLGNTTLAFYGFFWCADHQFWMPRESDLGYFQTFLMLDTGDF